ncbi:MAG: hypothetical protein ACRD6U_05180 [Nitrososphaeraceae archaeon]
MAGKKNYLVCPKCKKIGGALSLSWSKERSGIPKMSSIRTIADAFDGIGKMYLNLHILQLLMPPYDNSYDDLLPLLSKFSPYGQDKLNEIINSYYKNPKLKGIFDKEIEPFKNYIIAKIENYKKISRYEKSRYPLRQVFSIDEIGKISKMSIASLCYALICFSLRDLFNGAPFFVNGNLDYAIAIYHSHEPILHITRRNAINIFKLIDIILDSYKHGNHAAVSLNKSELNVCKECSKLNTKIKEHVPFEKFKNDQGEYVLQCPFCGGQEKLQRKVSSKYLKEIKEEKEIEFEILKESNSIYEKFVKKYSPFIKSLKEKREELIQYYKINEEKFLNGNFERKEYYSIGHYNPENKNKKCCRFTDLSQVKLEDSGYQMYERLLSQIVDIYILSKSIPPKTELQIQYKETCRDFYIYEMEKLPILLKELQFPIKFLNQKIQADLISYYQNKRYFN